MHASKTLIQKIALELSDVANDNSFLLLQITFLRIFRNSHTSVLDVCVQQFDILQIELLILLGSRVGLGWAVFCGLPWSRAS